MKKILFFIPILLLGVGCNNSEITYNTEEINNSSIEVVNTDRINNLDKVKYWAYQIDNQTEGQNIEKLVASDFDMIVLDNTRTIKEVTDYNNKADILAIKNSPGIELKKKLVIAYIDIGQAEDFRYYYKNNWKVGNPKWIVKKDPDGWAGDYPVAFWEEEWQQIILDYLDKIIDDGYDGIYMDWIEAYDDIDIEKLAENLGKNPAKEMINFIDRLATYARAKNPNFILISQNAVELVNYPRYLQIIDAVAQEQVWFDGGADAKLGSSDEGDWPTPEEGEFGRKYYISYLQKFQQAGLPVFTVDYAQKQENINFVYNRSRALEFIPYVSVRSLSKITELYK